MERNHKARKSSFLSIILLLYPFNNIDYFICVKDASLLPPLVWNTCTLASIINARALILGAGKRVLGSAMIPLPLWFGFAGLFVFRWGWLEPQLIVFMQGNHLAIAAAAVYLARNDGPEKESISVWGYSSSCLWVSLFWGHMHHLFGDAHRLSIEFPY